MFMNKRYQIYGRESTGISGLICVEKGIDNEHERKTDDINFRQADWRPLPSEEVK